MTDKEYEDLHKDDQPIIPDTTTPEPPVEEETPLVDDGSFPEHDSIVEGPHGQERIVHDQDEDGNPTGWHKEMVEGE